MPLISENWSNSILTGLRKVFVNVYREQVSNVPVLFNMQKSQKSQEFDLLTDTFKDFDVFNGQIPYDDHKESYKTTYTHQEYARGFKVERKLVMDDLYGTIAKQPAGLARSARARREKDGASVFNNAFSSGFTGGDSLSLCNSAHTSLNSTTTQSNTGVLSLSASNVEASRRTMIKYRDGRDNIISINPDMIVATIDLEETAWEILNSKGKVETAQNNVNFHYGKYRLLVWPNYLTAPATWFFVDSTYMKDFLLWFDREPVQFFKDQDFGTLVSAFAGYMRYSFGWSDWRWIMGQQGT